MAVTRTLGRYEILEEIGRGGTAMVYRARQVDLRRTVALKELNAFSAGDPAFARRFVRESWVSASLSHPNVVTVHDYFEADGTPCIAMEYLPSGSLRPRIGGLSLAQVIGTLAGILGGLTHAHGHGIVHRDLKPENVLVTGDGDVKIADFGIAKALDSMETTLTVTGTTIGTPIYMAPEQARAGDVGPWTDLYSLGVMAFELVAGRPPFSNADPVAVLLDHVKTPPPLLAVATPGTDPALADWVARLLAKEPGDRPASAATAWDELEDVALARLGARWRRAAPLPVAGAAVAVAADGATPGTQPLGTAAHPSLATTLPPHALSATLTPHALPVAAAAAAPAAATPPAASRPRRGLGGWRTAAALIVAGWAVAVLLMLLLAAAHQPAAPGGGPAASPAASGTKGASGARRGDGGGVGDSRSDDPSDDEPDGPDP